MKILLLFITLFIWTSYTFAAGTNPILSPKNGGLGINVQTAGAKPDAKQATVTATISTNVLTTLEPGTVWQWVKDNSTVSG